MRRIPSQKEIDADIRRLYYRNGAFPKGADIFVYEHERELWKAGYRAARRTRPHDAL